LQIERIYRDEWFRCYGRCFIHPIKRNIIVFVTLLAVSAFLLTNATVLAAQDQSAPGSDQPSQNSDQASPPADQSSPQDDQAAPENGQAGPENDQGEPAPYAKLSRDQLNRLVAPIALYPDSLVAQVLAASTFPSQIVDAENWVKAHPGLSGTDLANQVNSQSWDPSVKALVQFPSVLSNLASNLGWTSELGDAYYNQQEDVMKAVQEMRKKAKKAGNLNSTQQENIEDENGDVTITPTNPQVVYVPAYDPWAVYGYPIAPWPYWVDVPGVWWGGPGLYFGIGFPIAPFIGFGWGWGAWGVDWHHWGLWYHNTPYFARGPAFFNRGAYYGGRGDFARPGGYRGDLGSRNNYRGYSAPANRGGLHSGAFSGIDHGGVSRGFSARGQSSFGGFHGGGFGGGGFHGGGGGGRR
jgi:hypothetical protein